MSSSHSNISIFVPHIGCPNMCSFCNQRHITGVYIAPHAEDVDKAVKIAVSSNNYNPTDTEIAFFGGSFTAINRNYMISLLESAYKYVKDKTVKGIRISTRPDAINEEILSLLKYYGVTAIELGAQSLNEKVLKSNNRGHSAKDVYNASKLIKDYAFSLGIQMMTGLYRDTDENAIKTAKEIIAIAPDTVRIYPTIVLKDTDLAALYDDKKYMPQTLDEAVNLCAKLYLMFEENNIKVIRLGLHHIDKEAYIAGPWHPSFSELCQSKLFLDKVLSMLKKPGKYNIFVSNENISKMIGQSKSNIEVLKEKGYDCKIIKNNNLTGFQILTERI
ncbi:MAG: radical SAM protein [Clostridia bacterium]|nr:radical SAM protein [Clostridia bacterium]